MYLHEFRLRNFKFEDLERKLQSEYETNVLKGIPIEKSYFKANHIFKDVNDIDGFIVGLILNAKEKHDKYNLILIKKI